MIDETMPLIDLHRHLDGNVRLQTILDLGRQHHLPLPAWDLKALSPHVQVTDDEQGRSTLPGVMAFIAKFKWMVGVLVDYEACWRVACENVEDAQREGLDYVELRFSPWFMAEPHGLDPDGECDRHRRNRQALLFCRTQARARNGLGALHIRHTRLPHRSE